jgi:TP901 family phage tail tape measure protein
MGASTKFSATEAADAFSYMAMAGWKNKEMLDGIEGVMNLAAASGEDLATTSDIVTDALTAFGLKAKDSGHFADILAAASSNANTNVSMMGETFKYAAPIAGAMGFSAEDTAEAIGLMANAGIKASQAGTSLRQIMNQMSGPIKISGKALGDVTIQTTKADGSMRDLSDILDDCRKAFDKLTPAEKAQAAESIAGKNAMSAWLAMMNAGTSDIDKLRGAIKDCDGAAKDMADTMIDNLAGDITIFKSALEGAQIVVSDQLTPSLREFVQLGTKGLQDITTAFKERGLSGAMEALGDAITDGIELVITKLPVAVDAGMKLLGAIGQGILENVPTLFDAAFQVVESLADYLIQGLPKFTTTTVKIINTLGEGIVENIPALVDSAMQLIYGFANFLIESVPTLADAAWNIVGALVDEIGKNLPMLVQVATRLIEDFALYIAEALPELIPAAVQIIYSLYTALTSPDMLTRLVAAALAILQGLAQGLLDAIPVLLESVPVIWDNLITAFDKVLPKILDVGIGIIVQIVDGIVEYLPQLLEMAVTIVTRILDTLLDHIPELIQAAIVIIGVLADGISDALPTLIRQIPEIVTKIFGALVEHAPELLAAGVELIGALAMGILQSVGAILSAIGEVIVAISVPIGNLIQAALSWGGSILNNIVNGISQKWQNLTKIVGNVAKFLSGSFKNIWEGAKTWGSNIIANIINGVVEKWNAGVKFFSDIGKNIREMFTGLVDKARQWGADMIQNFKNGISDMWDSAVDKVRGFAQTIKNMLGFSEPEEGPLSNFHTYAPDMMKLFAQGIRDNEHLVTDAIDSAFDLHPTIAGSFNPVMPRQEIVVPRQTESRQSAVMQVDRTVFARLIYQLYNEEAQRVGVQLSGGVL